MPTPELHDSWARTAAAAELRMRAQVELVRAVQTASRQYCHRQLTWARGLPLFSWVDADQGQETVVEQILRELEANQHSGAHSLHHARVKAAGHRRDLASMTVAKLLLLHYRF